MLVYSCNGTCGNASGNVDMEGPAWTVSLTGTIYNPAGDCVLVSNANQQVFGQIVCNNVDLQGGNVSQGSGVNWNGTSVGTPTFVAQLIE